MEYARKHVVRRGDTGIRLSGRAYVVVCTDHMGSNVQLNGPYATISLCHVSWRSTAARGDVLFLVSQRGPIERATLRVDEGRLLLAILVDSGNSMAPSTFHSVAAPAWAKSARQRDRIYTCRVVGVPSRGQGAALAAIDDGRNQLGTPREVSDNSWIVRLRDGTELQYTLRPRARYHNLHQLDMEVDHRAKDFKNRVTVSRTFAVYPSHASSRKAVRSHQIIPSYFQVVRLRWFCFPTAFVFGFGFKFPEYHFRFRFKFPECHFPISYTPRLSPSHGLSGVSFGQGLCAVLFTRGSTARKFVERLFDL